jgi:hypothetical protein
MAGVLDVRSSVRSRSKMAAVAGVLLVDLSASVPLVDLSASVPLVDLSASMAAS